VFGIEHWQDASATHYVKTDFHGNLIGGMLN
jgi:hypothetical protein